MRGPFTESYCPRAATVLGAQAQLTKLRGTGGSWGVHCHFNTNVSAPWVRDTPYEQENEPYEEMQKRCKYCVIGIKDLEDDLIGWNTLYVAGRLHKPVLVLKVRSYDMPFIMQLLIVCMCSGRFTGRAVTSLE